MKRWYWAVAAALVMAGYASAAPLNPKQVAKDAKWVAHVDVDAMRESIVVKKAYEKAVADWKKVIDGVPKFRELFGMDPRKDLHGITVYGPKPGKPQGVLIVHADVDLAVLEAKVKTAPNHQVTKLGPYEVHSWTHPHGKSAGTFFKPNVLVFAETPEQVGAALAVLDGKAAGLDQGVCDRLAKDVPPGAHLVGWVTGLSEIPMRHKSPLISQSDSLGLATGEHAGTSFLKAALITKTPEMAAQVQKIVEGLKAVGEIHAAGDPDSKKLIDGVKISLHDKLVLVDASAPAETVWNVMLKHAEKAAKHHAKKKTH